MQGEIDIDSYFVRLGYQGAARATIDTLRELHRLHPQAIPFENLNPLLRRPVLLDMQSLHAKLVSQQRGGYCYEHNLLFKRVLELIGFRVVGLAARVLWNWPENAVRPRTHMLLQVHVDDDLWIADVGFGGLTLTAPLRLVEHIPQATPHESFRLTRLDGDYALQAEIRGAWRTLYRFDLQAQVLPDYEVANWYLSNHPESHFVKRLIAARTDPQRRYALLDDELAIHETGGETTRRKAASAAQLRSVLQDVFRISLEEDAATDAALARILTK